MYIEQEYDFDDVLILPTDYSSVVSRENVDLSQWIGKTRITQELDRYKVGFLLSLPIIASPMKGITDTKLIIELGKLGGIGILHKFIREDTIFLDKLEELENSNQLFGIAVSVSDDRRYKAALDSGANIICIDTANGQLGSVFNKSTEIASYVWKNNYNSLLMTGNVVTIGAVDNLTDCGVDLFRVGIGSGSLCTTRNNTAIGRPQISALLECYNREGIISDGGIRNAGDIVKALVAGADAVMIGGLFATTYESSHNGIICGGASRRLQEEYYHSVKSIEGLEKQVTPDTTLAELIHELSDNIRSACSYVDAHNLKQLRMNARFVQAGRGSIKKL